MPARNAGDIPVLANAALEFSGRQHYREAVDCYRKALSINPNIPAIQLNLGRVEFKRGDFKAALRPLGAAVAMEPQNVPARTLLGMSYYGAGLYAKAVPELERALAEEPQNTQLHHIVAQSCLWSGQYDRALKEFEWLLREHPDSAATHMLMGEALDGLGRSADAIVEFKAAAAVSPVEPQVHFGLGYLYWKDRRYDDAEAEFRRELENDPSDAQATAYLGDVLMHRGEPLAAEPLLEKARRANPEIRIARLDLGILYAGRKENERALRELREAVRLDSSRADAHYRLAQVYQNLGRATDAKAERAIVTRLHEKVRDDLVHQISGKPPAL